MNFLKRFWLCELLAALLLIQVSGAPNGICCSGPQCWWSFGFPLELWVADGFQLEETEFSARFFALIPPFDPKHRSAPEAAIPRTGSFLWEHPEARRNENCKPWSAHYWFLPIPFDYAFPGSVGALGTARRPRLLESETLTLTFWQAAGAQTVYLLLLFAGLLYAARSQTFQKHPVRWGFLFAYSQIMIFSAVFGAFLFWGTHLLDRFALFPWWLLMLESLNQIAVLVFAVCVWEWLSLLTRRR